LGYSLVDLSQEIPNPADDYPLIAKILSQEVVKNKGLGLLLCGSGNGVCMAANKIKGIRAALGYNTNSAKWARTDEDANILCLAGNVLSPEYALTIAKNFLETSFSQETRHQRRIDVLNQLDQ
jgi:ribose 5-phosphate isomerase B